MHRTETKEIINLRRKRPQSGQALIELAFVVPMLLALALGVIEIGRYAYIGILVGNAAHAGAVYGAQSLPTSVDTTGISNAALYDFSGDTTDATRTNGQNASKLTVTSAVTCGCDSVGVVTSVGCNAAGAGTCATGHWVVVLTVTATGTFNSLFNYPGIPASITVTTSSQIRL